MILSESAELLASRRRYALLKAIMVLCAVAATLVFSGLMLWFASSTSSSTRKLEKLTQCGSIPGRDILVIQRQNAQRLNNVLRAQGEPEIPIPAPRPIPSQCAEKE